MSSTGSSEPETVIATYRVQKDRLDDFMELIRRHHPTLVRLGLATDDEPIVYLGEEQGGGPIVFEIFTWVDGKAPRTAHELPEVAQVWEAMGTMVEERDGKPKFEFPHVEKLDLVFDDA